MKDNFTIFKEAIRIKKQKALSAVFIRLEIVHVKCTGSDDAAESLFRSVSHSPYQKNNFRN